MRLTSRHLVFVEYYLHYWNASQAAREAGYSANHGSQLLHKPEIEALVQMRIAETAMSADETLARLTRQARAEYAAYLRDDGTVDLKSLLKDGKGQLIRGVKWAPNGQPIIEFYDAQAALIQLGKAQGILTDRAEISIRDHAVEDMTDDELLAIIRGRGSGATEA